MMIRTLVLAVAAASVGSTAFAQSTSQAGPLPVTGDVPAVCAAGAVSGGDNVFAVGILIDTTTGFLRNDLSAPSKTLAASFCNARSTISITATPMTAQSATGAAPTGFTNAVDYSASASGWTATAATTNTGSGVNAGATQTRDTAFAGDIVVSLSNFAPAGGALRPVADPEYRGAVTVTLAATI